MRGRGGSPRPTPASSFIFFAPDGHVYSQFPGNGMSPISILPAHGIVLSTVPVLRVSNVPFGRKVYQLWPTAEPLLIVEPFGLPPEFADQPVLRPLGSTEIYRVPAAVEEHV